MTLHSGTKTMHTDAAKSFYSFSGSGTQEDSWIQPPLAQQRLGPSQQPIIDGIYAQSQHAGPAIAPELARELAAWEAASDEALLQFETERV